MTEIVQIIGRATRDAPGKVHSQFTNLIAEPDASQETVTDAINETLKAIAASLLMEQVLVPNFKFTPKRPIDQAKAEDGFDYGEGGYDQAETILAFVKIRRNFILKSADSKNRRLMKVNAFAKRISKN